MGSAMNSSEELAQLMRRESLGCETVARQLDVSVAQVQRWLDHAQLGTGECMPAQELKLLMYGLMTENRLKHLF